MLLLSGRYRNPHIRQKNPVRTEYLAQFPLMDIQRINLFIMDNGTEPRTGQGIFRTRIFPLQIIDMKRRSKRIFPKIRQSQKRREGNSPHPAPDGTLLCLKTVGKYPFVSHQMQFFITVRVIGLLKYGHIIRPAFVKITVFLRIHRIDLKTYISEILCRQPACFPDIVHVAHAAALSGQKQDLLNARSGDDFHLLFHLFPGQLFSGNIVITVESAVNTVIFTVVRQIQRREQIDRIAEMLPGLGLRPRRHLLQMPHGRRREKCFQIFHAAGLMCQCTPYVRIGTGCIVICFHLS